MDILSLQPVVELATAERKLTAEVFFFLCVKRAYLTEHICGFRPLPTTCAAPAVAFSPPRQEDGGFRLFTQTSALFLKPPEVTAVHS